MPPNGFRIVSNSSFKEIDPDQRKLHKSTTHGYPDIRGAKHHRASSLIRPAGKRPVQGSCL